MNINMCIFIPKVLRNTFSHLIVRFSDWGEDMHCLGRICFQKVVHQPVQQHGTSLFKARKGKFYLKDIVIFQQKCDSFHLDTAYYSPKLLYGQISHSGLKWFQHFVPVLRCSLMRPLISSSWWRSAVSRSGRRSPTLGCSLAMVVSVLEGWSEGLSEGVRPFLPAWSTPGATHQYSLQAPLHHTRVNSYTFLRNSSYLGLAATWQHQLGSEKQ